MPSAFIRVLAGLAGCAVLGGCAGTSARVTTYKPPLPPQGIILVADGAGGNGEASTAIAGAVKAYRAPLYVRSFDWTHGQGLGLSDLMDVDYARDEGRRMAEKLSLYRSTYPNTPIYVIAHSAGAHVALEATRYLPPNTLDRIILLAPAVAADYDLRPALAASKLGVDVFSSERDGYYLGLGIGLFGTADGERGVPAAGRYGFEVPPTRGPDAALYFRLHEHPWDRSVAWTGNDGSHLGSLHRKYLRAFVMPLLNAPIVTGPPH